MPPQDKLTGPFQDASSQLLALSAPDVEFEVESHLGGTAQLYNACVLEVARIGFASPSGFEQMEFWVQILVGLVSICEVSFHRDHRDISS